VTRFDRNPRGDGPAARLALVCVCLCLVFASLVAAAAAGPAEAGPHGSAPTAEFSPRSPAVAVYGLATTDSARPRLLASGLRTSAVGLGAVVVVGAGPGRAAATRRRRRLPLVLGDVGDRWRALLIGAPPVSFSF
jgi:hypothetical protein